jgi:hypothetical protein
MGCKVHEPAPREGVICAVSTTAASGDPLKRHQQFFLNGQPTSRIFRILVLSISQNGRRQINTWLIQPGANEVETVLERWI